MKRLFPLWLALALTACDKEEAERFKRESAQRQAAFDSLKREYDKLDKFKSDVIRDFGESASKLQERLEENRRLESEIERAKQTIAERNLRIDTLLNVISLREGEIQALQREIARQDALIKQQDALIKQQQAQLKQKDDVAESLNQAIASRDATIRSLNQTISQRDATIHKLNERVAEQDRTIQSLQKPPAKEKEKE